MAKRMTVRSISSAIRSISTAARWCAASPCLGIVMWWSLLSRSSLQRIDILPAASGEDSYGLSVRFPEMASVGSSHNRPTSAEDHEEALLLGCPPIGRLDESILCCYIQKNEREGMGLSALWSTIPVTNSRGFSAG